jgi:hypothetical protein
VDQPRPRTLSLRSLEAGSQWLDTAIAAGLVDRVVVIVRVRALTTEIGYFALVDGQLVQLVPDDAGSAGLAMQVDDFVDRLIVDIGNGDDDDRVTEIPVAAIYWLHALASAGMRGGWLSKEKCIETIGGLTPDPDAADILRALLADAVLREEPSGISVGPAFRGYFNDLTCGERLEVHSFDMSSPTEESKAFYQSRYFMGLQGERTCASPGAGVDTVRLWTPERELLRNLLRMLVADGQAGMPRVLHREVGEALASATGAVLLSAAEWITLAALTHCPSGLEAREDSEVDALIRVGESSLRARELLDGTGPARRFVNGLEDAARVLAGCERIVALEGLGGSGLSRCVLYRSQDALLVQHSLEGGAQSLAMGSTSLEHLVASEVQHGASLSTRPILIHLSVHTAEGERRGDIAWFDEGAARVTILASTADASVSPPEVDRTVNRSDLMSQIADTLQIG